MRALFLPQIKHRTPYLAYCLKDGICCLVHSWSVSGFYPLSDPFSLCLVEGNKKRLEYRVPDATPNIYLLEAALVLAGLDGIRRKIDPGNPVEESV
jgi:hypothetical protein